MIKTIIITIITSSGIIGIVSGAIIKRFKKKFDQNEALMYGVQALLRHGLYELYHYWAENKGFAPISVKEDFSNMYMRYHALGANGVMDGTHDEFMNLPTHCDGDGDEN